MASFLEYDPAQRISAKSALNSPYFRYIYLNNFLSEAPFPKDPNLFPSFPVRSAGEKRRAPESPPPRRLNERRDSSTPIFDRYNEDSADREFRKRY